MKAIHNRFNNTKKKFEVVLYPKDTEKWKQFTTVRQPCFASEMLFCIPKILKNESNSQLASTIKPKKGRCFVSQRYWKMKAIHNWQVPISKPDLVVLYPKDTEKWKQFTTAYALTRLPKELFCIPKILKNESNSQLNLLYDVHYESCFVSQRYWKMKAIHNYAETQSACLWVVLYPKDTEKWKQFTTIGLSSNKSLWLFCIPKILKNESNSQLSVLCEVLILCCFVSQRYWKMKAIHNNN